MLNFEFYNPTRILFGTDKIPELARHVPADARVLLLYGGASAQKTGTLDEVKAALGARAVRDRLRPRKVWVEGRTKAASEPETLVKSRSPTTLSSVR